MKDGTPIILRFGSCSCLPKKILLPQHFTTNFMHQGRKVTLPFEIQHVIISQEEKTMARFESRVHLFLDAHYRGSYWETFLDLCDIHQWSSKCYTPYPFRRRVRIGTQDLVLCAERWKIWQQPTLPSSDDILSGLKILLQRHKRKLGWDALPAWFANMTPTGWTLPESFSLIESS
ncbi:MAG: hypothetical protein HY617_04105 [Candidatus Sungbacteria bacterium]|nr:hypothetical protein [Candidatus Sungbacteria bacterium]